MLEYKLIWISRIISILVSYYIINRAKKNVLIEKESFFWVVGSIILLIIAFFPKSLNAISNIMGIQYPPATLFFISNVIIVILLYRQFEKISLISNKNNDLIKTVAILSFEIETLKQELRGTAKYDDQQKSIEEIR